MLFKGKFDAMVESLTRRTARRLSRRGFLARMGSLFGGAALLPLLPMDRRAHARGYEYREMGWRPQARDPHACDYWRHCSIDGNLCDCCGGGLTDCPPGTTLSPSSWVASCFNPEDGHSYMIAYRDCCGKQRCPRCGCLNTEGELPLYRPEWANDIVWCFGAPDSTYHCTISPIVGRNG